MRRIVLLSVLLSFALGTIGSATPPPADAASARIVISLPGSVTRGRLTSARISLPGAVAAVDGRVLVSSKAAEVVGLAVPRRAVSMMPVTIKGGYAFGAYNLKASHGKTVVDVVLLPRKSGRIGIKVIIDAMSDARGRRIPKSGTSGLSASRTVGASEASRKTGMRRGSRVYGSGSGTARFLIPAASGRVDPRREASGLRSLYGTRKITRRDLDYARQAWTLARSRNLVCDAKSALDPNDDGCADIVDLQATLVAEGRRAGRSAIKPTRTTAPTTKRPRTTTGSTTPDVSEPVGDEPTATEEPAATEEPKGETAATEEPASAEDPAPTEEPQSEPAATEEPAVADPGGDGTGGGNKGARGKVARPGSVARTTITDIVGLTFTVTSTADTVDAARGNGVCADANGKCTLRAALAEADFLKGDDRIEFNLAGTAPVTIQLTSRLPYITSRNGTVYIDGYSQPGSSVNTAEFGSNAVMGIELRGNGNSAKEVGLVINSPGNTVRGLLINNVYRGIMLDGIDAHDNRIIGNWIGFTKSGGRPSQNGNFAVILNTGAKSNVVGTPNLANRNVIGNYSHAVEHYGAGTNGNIVQNNLLCIAPGGGTATCSNGIDHNFGPKNGIIGGDGEHEYNVIGPTTLQGIEYSHGWDSALPWGTDTATTYQINDNSAIGNWVGFRMDGSYSASYRSGLNFSSGDNGQAINVYDGSNRNNILRNHIAATYDGIQVMAPNATGNVVRGNIIGVAPNGDAAPLTGWGIKLRWGAVRQTVANNTIRNAALGGIGLVQDTVYNVRISRNIVTDTNGPAIYLAPRSGSTTNGANTLLPAPVIAAATTDRVSGTGISGALVEVYRATRAAGEQGLPVEFLGDATVNSSGSWHLDISGVDVGQRVTALQIRTDDNTSALGINLAVIEAEAPPQPGDLIRSDDFGRTLSAAWGDVDQGVTWVLTGTAANFSVDGSAGRITSAAGATREARVGTDGVVDVSVTGTLRVDRVPTGANVFAYVLARANSNSGYRAAIRVATNGRVYVQLKRAVSNVESNVGSEVAVSGLTITAGMPIKYRFDAVGTNLRLRVWAAAAAEPAAWTVTGSDSTTALQDAGSAGLRTYIGSNVSNGPLAWSLDDFRVRVP